MPSNTPTAYQRLILALADRLPFVRHAGQIKLDIDELGTALAHDPEIVERALSDPHCRAEIADQINASYPPSNMDEAVGAIAMRYIDIYAQPRVYEDLRDELIHRQDVENGDVVEMPATEARHAPCQELWI